MDACATVTDADIEQWDALCRKVARGFHSLTEFGFSSEDRVQVARMGVYRALSEWRPDGGASRKTMCWRHARWAILNESRQYALKDRVAKSGDDELKARNAAVRRHTSLDQMMLSREDGGVGLEPRSDDPEHIEGFDDLLDHADLTDRERAILCALYRGGRSMAEVCRAEGVSRERIRQIKGAALSKLRRAFAMIGPKADAEFVGLFVSKPEPEPEPAVAPAENPDSCGSAADLRPAVAPAPDESAAMAWSIMDTRDSYQQRRWAVVLRLRDDERLTQRETGERIGLSIPSVSRIERDARKALLADAQPEQPAPEAPTYVDIRQTDIVLPWASPQLQDAFQQYVQGIALKRIDRPVVSETSAMFQWEDTDGGRWASHVSVGRGAMAISLR